nr:DEAD/DEAH box helicase [uncultured Trichococcus sp.]
MDGKELYGRELTRSECLSVEDVLLALAEKRPGLDNVNGKLACNRCGNQDRKKMQATPCSCGTDCFYCLSCLNMGKIKSCTVLHHLPETNAFERHHEPILQWKGQLSSEQQRASEEIVETVQAQETRLIWAVAGAGKTEMIFEGIAACLRKGGRVCLASPRVDVCLELAPRIKLAFPDVSLALLYGGSEEGYCYTPLVIATTHQLLRFREAFDFLIIDEIDSFPYHNDASLQFGAQKSRKKASALIYLTATPSRLMQNDIKRGRLAATVLPARYHGFALPEPECLWIGNWRKAVNNKKRSRFLALIRREFQQQRRFLLFLPHIQLMEALDAWLKELFPDKQFTCVSASDPDREEKVKRMRAEEYDFLMTTTILERGVTFRDIDVIVLGAEDRVFTEASLVQIAGRVGRHKDFPTGWVCFAHEGETKAIQGAVRQIRSMNRQAGRKGLLNGSVSVLPK